MAQTLELWYKEFKGTMITTLRALMENVDHRQQQMGSVSRESGALGKNQNKTWEAKLSERNEESFGGSWVDRHSRGHLSKIAARSQRGRETLSKPNHKAKKITDAAQNTQDLWMWDRQSRDTKRIRKRELSKEMFEWRMAKIFPKLLANTRPQIQESWETQSEIKTRHIETSHARHIVCFFV